MKTKYNVIATISCRINVNAENGGEAIEGMRKAIETKDPDAADAIRAAVQYALEKGFVELQDAFPVDDSRD